MKERKSSFRLNNAAGSLLLYIGLSFFLLNLPQTIYHSLRFFEALITNPMAFFNTPPIILISYSIIPMLTTTITFILSLLVIIVCIFNLVSNKKEGKPLGIWFGFKLDRISIPTLFVLSSLMLMSNLYYLTLFLFSYIDISRSFTNPQYLKIYYLMLTISSLIQIILSSYAIISCTISSGIFIHKSPSKAKNEQTLYLKKSKMRIQSVNTVNILLAYIGLFVIFRHLPIVYQIWDGIYYSITNIPEYVFTRYFFLNLFYYIFPAVITTLTYIFGIFALIYAIWKYLLIRRERKSSDISFEFHLDKVSLPLLLAFASLNILDNIFNISVFLQYLSLFDLLPISYFHQKMLSLVINIVFFGVNAIMVVVCLMSKTKVYSSPYIPQKQ